MSVSDRWLRSLFVAAAVGLGWGIRGDFGHMVGAMYPGAALGLGFAYVSGQRSMFRWMPLLGAVAALGISLGGRMSYGVLHGYAKSDTFLNYSYGYLCLILQGGAWGGFGGVAIGLALERHRLRFAEWVSLVATVFAFGWTVYHLVVTVFDFHINPPRSDLSIGYTGAIVGLFVWLRLRNKTYAFRGAFFGYLGFAVGMSLGRFLANAAYALPESLSINNWNVMEISCGFFGGLIFTFGMLGRRFPDPPDDAWHPLLSKLGALYVLAGIPLYHRILRIHTAEKLESYAKTATSLQIAEPDVLAEKVISYLDGVCLLGFVAAAVFLYLHARNVYVWSALPVLMLSGLMLLFQNLNALYFWRPVRQGYINTQTWFWVLFLFLVAFASFYRLRDVVEPDEAAERLPWRRWVVGGAAVYLLIIGLSCFVNGEKTMSSANTRWPIWSWPEGKFPGR